MSIAHKEQPLGVSGAGPRNGAKSWLVGHGVLHCLRVAALR